MNGYVPSKLVKLDILINKEEIDALSFILHADTAYERGRKMCEKLKNEIPRQLFEIPIQAAVGGKVEKMYLPNVTVVIFPERENFLKNRKKVKRGCASLEM